MDLVARALQEDRGVVDLNLTYGEMEPETLGVLCNSLQTHPSLEELHLPRISTRGPVSAEDHWMHRIVEMLQENTVVQMIWINMNPYSVKGDPVGTEIYKTLVRPLLKLNEFRNCIRSIKKAPISLREKLFGRALQKVREDPTRVWMLLSENASAVLDELWKSPIVDHTAHP
jgi:hypothetical protein